MPLRQPAAPAGGELIGTDAPAPAEAQAERNVAASAARRRLVMARR